MNVMYGSYGDGKWWRTEWEPQCEEKILCGGKCQGTSGHDDVHWSFRPDGSFAYDELDGGAGWIPPGHESYRTPESMQDYHHLKFKKVEEVTDPAILKRLEDDDPPEEFALINKPLSPDDPFYEEMQRRMKDVKDNS